MQPVIRPEATGIRFVLADCAQPGREAELNEWYDQYAAGCTRPGLLVDAIRYEARVPAGQPRYAAIYNTVDPDLEQVWPRTQAHPLKPALARSPLLAVALKATYRRIAPWLPMAAAPLPAAVALVLCDWEDPASVDELDAWVQERMRALVAGGAVSHASRYEIVDGEPSPPRYLEVYESSDPAGLRCSDGARPAAATTRYAGLYDRTFAHRRSG